MIERLGYYGLFFYCFSMAVSRAAVHTSIALLTVLFLVFAVRRLVNKNLPENFIGQSVPMRGLLIFLMGMGISLLASANVLVSLRTIVTFTYYFLPLFFVDAFIRNKEQLLRLCQALAASVILGGGVAAYQGFFQGVNRAKGFVGVMDLGGALGLAVPTLAILGVWAYREGNVKSGTLWTLAAMVGIAGLFANGTRINWIEVAVAIPVFVLLNFKRLSKGQLVALSVFLLGIAAVVVGNDAFLMRVQSMANISTDASNYKRIEMWGYGIDVFLQHPVIGVGIGVLPKLAFDALEHIDYVMTDGSYGHIHSVCIQLLAETGVIGLLSYFLFLFYTFIRPWKISNDAQQPWASILIVLLISFFINGMTDHILGIGTIVYAFSILTAICLRGMRLN